MSDADEFEMVVADHYENLFRFGMSLSGTEADACDLVQTTFAIFARKGHQLRDRTKVKTWLFTTLRREFLRQRGRAARFVEAPDDGVVDESTSVGPSRVVDADTALRALGALPLEYREPLTLFYLEDYSYQEIADILEIPIGTVMSRLSRAKNRLRAMLGNE